MPLLYFKSWSTLLENWEQIKLMEPPTFPRKVILRQMGTPLQSKKMFQLPFFCKFSEIGMLEVGICHDICMYPSKKYTKRTSNGIFCALGFSAILTFQISKFFNSLNLETRRYTARFTGLRSFRKQWLDSYFKAAMEFSQLTSICLKSAIETLEKIVKYVESYW